MFGFDRDPNTGWNCQWSDYYTSFSVGRGLKKKVDRVVLKPVLRIRIRFILDFRIGIQPKILEE